MKTKLFYIGLMIFALQSCDFLDRDVEDAISKDQFFSTASGDGLEKYCNYFYPRLIKGHGDPQAYNFGMLEAEFQSDNIYTWSQNDVSFGLHVAPTDAKNTEWNWENIRACNDFLAYYKNSIASEKEKERYAGEILFFKTLDYFNKLKTYGDVPWYDKVINPDDPDMYKPRDSRVLVAQNMLKDIDQAILWLPYKKDVDVTRVSKDAALALKARFCLFEGTWRKYHGGTEGGADTYLNEAYEAAGRLMSNEFNYSLFKGTDPDKAYHELFIQADYATNPEVILSKAYDPALGKGNNLSRQIGVGEVYNGVSQDCIDDYLCAKTGKPITKCGCPDHTARSLNALKDRDPRLLQSVCSPFGGEHSYYLDGFPANISNIITTGARGSSSTGYSIAKFYNSAEHLSAHHQGTLDAPIFRFAEILLIRAEAAAELGKDAELDKTVNVLRERVGFTHKLSATPEEDPKLVEEYPNVTGANANLIREIRRERRVELFGEGYRYDDLRRWKCGARLDSKKVKRVGMIVDENFYLNALKQGEKETSEDFAKRKEALKEAFEKLKAEVGYDEKGRIDVYGKRMKTQPTFDEKKHYLFAIPVNEIALNPKLEQNPNW